MGNISGRQRAPVLEKAEVTLSAAGFHFSPKRSNFSFMTVLSTFSFSLSLVIVFNLVLLTNPTFANHGLLTRQLNPSPAPIIPIMAPFDPLTIDVSCRPPCMILDPLPCNQADENCTTCTDDVMERVASCFQCVIDSKDSPTNVQDAQIVLSDLILSCDTVGYDLQWITLRGPQTAGTGRHQHDPTSNTTRSTNNGYGAVYDISKPPALFWSFISLGILVVLAR